jgi:uncharacterized membrane protein YeiH
MLPEAIIYMQYFGTIVLAVTGCLVAARKRGDILAFILFGLVTAVGGGTLRDLIIGRTPIFWVIDASYLIICVAVAFLMFRGLNHMRKIKHYEFYLVWADALGLATFTIVGTHIAIAADVSHIAAILLGVMSASFGGIIRDIIAGEETLILRQDIYMMAGIIGAAAYIICLDYTSIPHNYAVYGCIALIFAVRGAAIQFNLKMPGHRYFEQ